MRIISCKTKDGRRRPAGYSLIEVLVASAILLIGISAAASFSLTMTTQEELNYRLSRGVNLLENIAQLYQLGLDQAAIGRIIPPEPAVTTPVSFSAFNEANLEGVTITVTVDSVADEGDWSAGEWTGGSQSAPAQRAFSARAFRPSTR